MDRDGDAEEARVEVAVVEGGAEVDGMVLVEDVGVEAGVHALTRAAYKENLVSGRGERAKDSHAPAEKDPPPPSKVCNVAAA